MSTQKKVKKCDQAFSIYQKHLPQKDAMKKREFRAMVVAEMSEQLGVTNKGTLGMYFAWSEQVITARPAKVYSRGDGARARKGSRLDDQAQADLNKLALGGGGKKSKLDVVASGFNAAPFGARL